MSATLLEISEVKLTKISKEYYALLCQENPLHYQKTELLEGVIFDKMTKSNDHDFYSQKRIFSAKEEIPLFGKFISLKNIFSE